jgi:hypothetical protein
MLWLILIAKTGAAESRETVYAIHYESYGS